MGNRIDLMDMFDIPEELKCNKCNKLSYPHGLSEYSGEVRFVNGVLNVQWYCEYCEGEDKNSLTIRASVDD